MQDNSLQDRIQGNWKQLSGGVRHEWGKLTDNDVEEIKGNVEMLAGKIEERYGVTKVEGRSSAGSSSSSRTKRSNGKTTRRRTSLLSFKGAKAVPARKYLA